MSRSRTFRARGDVPHSYEALAAGTTFVLVMQHV
ncbi:hypothetical protein QFZ76_005965 [Streptomyces sp. V4I2]|nr:hypothetical protein [Streptomyces sp. V4I2]